MFMRFLFAIVATLLAGSAMAQTRFEIVDDCKRRITVPIEIYTIPTGPGHNFRDADNNVITDSGNGASEAYAAEMKRQAEALWNGISAQEAETFATLAGTSTQIPNWRRRTTTDPATGETRDIVDENTAIAIDRNEVAIRGIFDRYANEFGATCAYTPCCEIEFVMDVPVSYTHLTLPTICSV